MSSSNKTPHTQRDTDGREIALEQRQQEEARLFSPSAGRNHKSIVEAYKVLMPVAGTILEIGSGTGEHGFHITNACPELHWQPSDPDAASRTSIDAWAAFADHVSIAPALNLDLTDPTWLKGLPDFNGIVSINMIHIAPFAACEALFAGCGVLLSRASKLFLYGPFKRAGQTAPSNLDFDESLKSRNPDWGVRDIEKDLVLLADQHALKLADIREMPTNNLCVTFEKL